MERDHGQAAYYPFALYMLQPRFLTGDYDYASVSIPYHYYTFVICFSAVIAFYLLAYELFNDRRVALLCAVTLFIMPRFFAESHYNNKDMVLFSLLMDSFCFGIRAIKHRKIVDALLFALVAALAANTKIIGVFFFGVIGIFYIIYLSLNKLWDKKGLIVMTVTISAFCLLYYAFTPAMWKNPISFFEYCFNNALHFSRWAGTVLFGGQIYRPSEGELPRRYLPQFMLMTTPIFISILATVGGCRAVATIFGKEKHPQLVYTDLATGKSDSVVEVEPDILTDKNIINAFPGYEWVRGEDGRMHNMFRGTDLGLGGYVYAEPGMYYNIALLDVASLHPHSAVALNYFGDYTKNFKDLMDVRIYVKHGEYDKAKKLFGGKLSKYLDDPAQAKALAQALKIAINSVYGLTSATFDNPFRNPKNANNIVALRGALFMRTLQDEVQQRGFTVAHIKTDSIKIPDATPEIIDFCMDFAKKYGYTFEHEATYEKMCLVNNAVYIAKYLDADTAKAQYGYIPEKN